MAFLNNTIRGGSILALSIIAYVKYIEEQNEFNTTNPHNSKTMPINMYASSNCKSLVIDAESFRSHAYYDNAKHLTIGYGHLIKPGESFPNGITRRKASEIFYEDINKAQNAVQRLVKVPLSQNQFDALTSLTYNIGVGAFENSTLLRELNQQQYVKASLEFMKWVNVTIDGKETISKGLVKRRSIEKALFCSEDNSSRTTKF